jgi:4'-phosphopantetheinyl transferase
LSHYLQQNPADISIVIEPKGRPKLENNSNLFFNVSHSKGLISCAMSTTPELGIDIENRTRSDDYLRLAAEVFSAKELQMLASCEKK